MSIALSYLVRDLTHITIEEEATLTFWKIQLIGTTTIQILKHLAYFSPFGLLFLLARGLGVSKPCANRFGLVFYFNSPNLSRFTRVKGLPTMVLLG